MNTNRTVQILFAGLLALFVAGPALAVAPLAVTTITTGDEITVSGTVVIQRQGDSVSVALQSGGTLIPVVMDQQARALLTQEGRTVEARGVMQGGKLRIRSVQTK